jgi:hypothetical protein
MKNGKADHPSNELEVVEMLRIDARVWVDLKGVVVVGGVFKETVEGIEHFMGEEEEEFSANGISNDRNKFPIIYSPRETAVV